jgi:Na+/H+-dicarboxylate symporter
MNMHTGRGMPLHTKMLIGFVAGALLGMLAHWQAGESVWLSGLVTWVTDPIGQLFLRLLFMLVVPLVFAALMLGVIEIGDPKSLGRIGLKTLVYILVVTGIAVTIGLVMVNLLEPGRGLPPEVGQSLIASASEKTADIAAKREGVSAMSLLLNIVPRNPVASAANGDLIGLMFFALMFGVAASVIATPGVRSFVAAVQGVYDISLKLIGWVIQLAPYAVFALLFSLTAKLGYDVLIQLARFVLTVTLALAIHFFIVFPLLVRFVGGMSPLQFFKRAEPAILTAFSTSSSSATLPTTLQVAEERLGIPRRVGRFVCTLGATANMNGTALFEGVTVLFLAQFFNVDLSLAQQVMVLFVCVLGGIGAAGVPGGSLPVIASILVMFGIPPEGIGLILGVDRFLDMCRTTVNVTGDLVGSVVIARGEPQDAEAVTPALPGAG